MTAFKRALDIEINGCETGWYERWPHHRDPYLISLLKDQMNVVLIKNKNGQRYTVELGPKGKLLFYKEKS